MRLLTTCAALAAAGALAACSPPTGIGANVGTERDRAPAAAPASSPAPTPRATVTAVIDPAPATAALAYDGDDGSSEPAEPEWKPGEPRPGDVFDPGPHTGYSSAPGGGVGSGNGGAYDGDDGSSEPPKPPRPGGWANDGDDGGEDSPPRAPGGFANDGDDGDDD
jgi:hypothetical protein